MASPGLGAESWDDLFNFLDPQRRNASTAPIAIRMRKAGARKSCANSSASSPAARCANPEDLATETILGSPPSARDVDVSSFTDRVGYFYGVARNVVHEVHRSGQRESRARESFIQEVTKLAPPDPDAWKHAEAVRACLERCLGKLPQSARQLILRYYTNEGSQKIASHRALADELGKSVNALRIEAHRIRKTLQECMFSCLSRGTAAGITSLSN